MSETSGKFWLCLVQKRGQAHEENINTSSRTTRWGRVKSLAIRVRRKLNSIDVIDVLSELFILRGVPGHIRSDNVLRQELCRLDRQQISIH